VSLYSVPGESVWLVYPLLASLDGRVFFVGAAVWLWAGPRLVLGVYRWMLGWGMGKRVVRRRVRRLGWYGAGVMLVETGLLGAAAVCAAISGVEAHDEPWWSIVQCMPSAGAGLALAAAGVLWWAASGMVWGTGGRRGWRMAAMAGVFPVVAAAALAGALVVTMWAAGFMGLAAWAMTH
jgi:hypothetical protein